MRFSILSILILAVFIIVLIPASASYAQETYMHHLKMGEAALEQKAYRVAEQELSAALELRPDGQEATLNLGILMSRTGRPREAERLLKKALFLDPLDQRANLEMGIFYFNKYSYSEATDFFEIARDLDPNNFYAHNAGQYLEKIKGRFEPESDLNIALSTGLQYDTNVVLAPDNGLLPGVTPGKPGTSDWRALASFRLGVKLAEEETTDIELSYNFYQNLHRKLDEFNVTSNDIKLDFKHKAGADWKFGLYYSFEFDYVGLESYVVFHTLSPSAVYDWGKGSSTAMELKYKVNTYYDSALYADNSLRTGSGVLLGITHSWPLSGFVKSKAGYAVDFTSAETDYWDYTGHKLFAGADIDLPLKFSAGVEGEYVIKTYGGEYPFSGKERADETAAFAFSLSRDFFKRLGVFAGYTVISSESNIPELGYGREIWSLLLSTRF